MKESKLKIEYVPVDSLKPYDKNARKHENIDIEAIKSSIVQFGMCDPIGIWGKQNIIVEGHGRLLALKELGYKEVPVIRLDHLSDNERKAYGLAHNRTAELSKWDLDIVIDELKTLEDDFDFDSLGFSDPKFSKTTEEAEDDNFDVDAATENIKEVYVKKGDIYKLGNHILMCGSSTVEEDVESLMNDSQADLLLTDPPYNVDYVGKTKDALKIENDAFASTNSYINFLTDAFKNADNLLKQGGGILYLPRRERII